MRQLFVIHRLDALPEIFDREYGFGNHLPASDSCFKLLQEF